MAGKRKGGKVRRLDRNKLAAPMTGFARVPNPEGADEVGVLATFENNKYGVFLKQSVSHGFSVPGPDGQPRPMEILQLIIVRLDKKRIEIPWAEKQAIKNELLGPMTEAMELFPSEMRRMTTIAGHQTHLWALPPGATIPVGLVPKAMQEMGRADQLEKLKVTPEELEVYAVDDDGVTQIFESEAEAKKLYEEAGNELEGGSVVSSTEALTEEKGAVWSNVAKVKMANALEKASVLSNLMDPDAAPGGEATKINTNGPHTDQDDLEDSMGVVDESPNGDEENVMMPEFMKLGMEKMQVDRHLAIEDAVAKLRAKMESDKEASEVNAKAEAEAEEAAGDELAAMREKARQERKKAEEK